MTPEDEGPLSSTRGLVGPRIAAVAVLALGGIILAQVSQIGSGAGFIVVGPHVFPLAVGIGLLVLGILLLLRTTIRVDKDLAADVAAEDAATDWRTVLVGMLSLVVYAALLHPLGYTLATALYFPVGSRILGSNRLWRDIVVGVVLGFAIYLAFTRLLGVRLPAGLLEGIL